MEKRTIPLLSHYCLSDLVLDSASRELNVGIKKGLVDPPDVLGVQKFYAKSLENARRTIPFSKLSMSIQLASNASTQNLDPFVHVFTSMPDQGTGILDLLYARKRITQELMFSYDEKSDMFSSLKEKEKAINEEIKDIEKKCNFKDGAIQVDLGDFFEDEDFGAIVSESKDFSINVPNLFSPVNRNGSNVFSFGNNRYPPDSTVYFQVHSKIKNSENNDCYELSGTGHLHFSKMIKKVLNKMSNPNRRREEESYASIEIPLILSCVSSQDPKAELVKEVARSSSTGNFIEPYEENKALYEGSIFLHVNTKDKETENFFLQFLSEDKKNIFDEVSRRDITEGNFPYVANLMRYHVIRDMSPFIPELTSSVPITVEYQKEKGSDIPEFQGSDNDDDEIFSSNIGDSIIIEERKGWVFQPSLKEGEKIHAPYNKGTTHAAPGFTYYHDKMMQRLPDTRFILNATRIVLDRWNLSEEDFIRNCNNPLKKTETGEFYFDPKYIDALNIVGEIICSYPTSMNYRGDYADMNTIVSERMRSNPKYFNNHRHLTHMDHATGLTRVPQVKPKHKSKWSWDGSKKIGTEMFGDAVIDRSGDCEDFSKLINRVFSGIKSCNSTHPLIKSLQSVLDRYKGYSVLSSVTSASIMGDIGNKTSKDIDSFEFETEYSNDEVGSYRDSKASIGAHMFSVLIPRKMEERAFESTKGIANLNSSSLSRKSKANVDEETFIDDHLPPLVLEGTGPARALLLAQETYHKTIPDKIRAINSELLRIEATARLMTGMTSDQLTSEEVSQSPSIFNSFIMPIKGDNLVDYNPDERVSSFYRMPVEMFSVEDGYSDIRVTPKNVISVQYEIKKNRKNPNTIISINLSDPKEEDVKKMHEEYESNYFSHRSIPVQLKPRSEIDFENHKNDSIIGYTYGVNMTDIAHRREDIFGLLKTIKSNDEESQVIDDIMRHSAPSAIIQEAPVEEKRIAKGLALKYEKILNENIDETLSRGYMGREEDLYTINLYVRTDNIKEEQIVKLSQHLRENGYIGQDMVRVIPESFARGHHLLRISIPVDVTGSKQIYLESNALAERLNDPSIKDTRKEREEDIRRKEKKFLIKNLKALFSSK